MQNGKYSKKECSSGRTWSDIIPQCNLVDNNGIFESTLGTPFAQQENWNQDGFVASCQDRISMLFPSSNNNDTSKPTSNSPINLYGLTFKNILVVPNDMMIYRKLLVKGNPIVITIPIKDLENPRRLSGILSQLSTKGKDLHSLIIVGYSDQKQAFRIEPLGEPTSPMKATFGSPTKRPVISWRKISFKVSSSLSTNSTMSSFWAEMKTLVKTQHPHPQILLGTLKKHTSFTIQHPTLSSNPKPLPQMKMVLFAFPKKTSITLQNPKR